MSRRKMRSRAGDGATIEMKCRMGTEIMSDDTKSWIDEPHLIHELRQKFPGKGRRADHLNSRVNAIALHCLECAGGRRTNVAQCPVQRCALWVFRPFGETVRDPGVVPTVEEYVELTERWGNSFPGGDGEGDDE